MQWPALLAAADPGPLGHRSLRRPVLGYER